MEFPGHVPVVITAKNGWETTLLLPEKFLHRRRTSVIVLPSASGNFEERHLMILQLTGIEVGEDIVGHSLIIRKTQKKKVLV